MNKAWTRRWLMSLCLLPVVLFPGCKGFWDAPPSTGGGGTGSASGVFYVLNQQTAEIAAFAFASGSATPAVVSGSPFGLGTPPFAMAISPGGTFLYVSTAAGIYVYAIGSGGALTIQNSQQPIASDPATTMVVDPTGTWLLETVSGTGTLQAIPVSSTSGILNSTLAEQSVDLPTTTALQLAISPANSASPYVFVAMGGGGTAVIPFNSANIQPLGTAVRIAVKHISGGDNTVAVAPDNSLLFVGETVALTGTQTGGLRVFTIAATKITEISGSPFATGGTGPSSILAPSGYVYVANRVVSGSTKGNITGYSITANGSVYTLSQINSLPAGIATAGLAEDSTGTYLLAVSTGGNPDLSTYTFDTTTAGKLVAGNTAATGTDPVQAIAIAAVP